MTKAKEEYVIISPGARAADYKQPDKGILDPDLFTTIEISSDIEIGEPEFIASLLVSISAVYLFRILKLNIAPETVFAISKKGAYDHSDHPDVDYTENWKHNFDVLLTQVKGLDDESIISAVRLSAFNSYYTRIDAGIEALNIRPKAISNIRNMVKRISAFADSIGLVNDASELHFEKVKAKKTLINIVDRHFVVGDTFWHIKAFRPGTGLNKLETLELLIFYLFGLRSPENKKLFSKVKKLGIFDSRTNKTYVINVSDIPKSAIDETSKDVVIFD